MKEKKEYQYLSESFHIEGKCKSCIDYKTCKLSDRFFEWGCQFYIDKRHIKPLTG